MKLEVDIALLKEIQKEKDIVCPFCGHVENDSALYPVSYWGDEGQKPFTCRNCKKIFFVHEHVRRWYTIRDEKYPLMTIISESFIPEINCPSCNASNLITEKRCLCCGYPLLEYMERANKEYEKNL